MGTTKVESSGTTKPTPTPEETEMNKLLLARMRATQEGTIGAQQSGLSLVNQLLTGNIPLPGFFGTMAEGISPEAIGAQSFNLAQRSLPQFQASGLLDSGVMGKQISRSIANEILFPAQQFNIGALQNLLNLALSGQAQVQQPIAQGTGQLGQQLAGLRTITQTSMQRNPFLTGADIMGGIGMGLGTWGALRGTSRETSND